MSFKALLAKQIKAEANSHSQGIKRVFINNNDTTTALTQFAYGIMEPDEQSGTHSHKTMDEYFYFISGNGIYEINDQIIEIVPETFVCIPRGNKHNLINKSDKALEFVYFGIATD